jgi:hypothetical protein
MMPPFSPELIGIMRAALEEAMTKVPSRQATPAIKAHLAQSILRAAAKGQTSAEELIMAAINELPTILSFFSNDAGNADKWSTSN